VKKQFRSPLRGIAADCLSVPDTLSDLRPQFVKQMPLDKEARTLRPPIPLVAQSGMVSKTLRQPGRSKLLSAAIQ
jgi:hypothetical protein